MATKLLALETSTRLGSAALVIDGLVVAEKSSRRQKSHSEILNTFISELLEENSLSLSDLDGFAVGEGPGSFTGLRIAGNIGKTFAYSFKKPMVAVDTLTLLADAAPRDLPVFAIMNAYKNMVYYGLFKAGGGFPEFIQGPGVVPVKSLGDVLKCECTVVGDGYSTYEAYLDPKIRDLMRRPSDTVDEPTAGTLGRLAHEKFLRGLTLDWNSFVPLYIRASEAEENKRGIFIPSL